VPEPAGRPLPSGAMEMSQAAASASLMGLPNLGASAAEAAVAKLNATAEAARNDPRTRRATGVLRTRRAAARPCVSSAAGDRPSTLKGRGDLFSRIDMADGSVGGDGPAADRVHMAHR